MHTDKQGHMAHSSQHLHELPTCWHNAAATDGTTNGPKRGPNTWKRPAPWQKNNGSRSSCPRPGSLPQRPCRQNGRSRLPITHHTAPESATIANEKKAGQSHGRQETNNPAPAGGDPPGGTGQTQQRTPSRGQVRSQGGLVTNRGRRRGTGQGQLVWLAGGQIKVGGQVKGIVQLLGQAGNA